jgi:2,4-dienoyl-CoA reductase-like NADH-dependent reductase (Old Yellow Enzyme family)
MSDSIPRSVDPARPLLFQPFEIRGLKLKNRQSFKPLIALMKGEGTAISIQLAHGGRKASSQRAMEGMGPLTAENIAAGAKVWQPVGPTSDPVAPGSHARAHD